VERSYQEWVQWLENRSLMPLVKPGLDNTRRALEDAGLLKNLDPKKIIHIAGTNGKGTTAKTLEQLLLSQNKSVGLYTSPHLIDTCERLRVNNRNIDTDLFVGLCKSYEPLIEKWNLSHFETLTLFAVDFFFKHHQVDFAIFEIGLGGTWDATNAIPHATSVITSIGMDHMNILGNDIKVIAENKFGIIHKNNKVLHFQYTPEIQQILIEKIKLEEATPVITGEPEFVVDDGGVLPTYFLVTEFGETKLSLLGRRAAQNMWLALKTFESLGFPLEKGLPVLENIQWPARMTPLSLDFPVPVYLSGDHNIQGLESLMEILLYAHYHEIYFILGLSKNRRHEDFVELLEEVPRSSILFTRPEFNGIEPEDDSRPFYKSPMEALTSLKTKVQKGDLVVVTGSLYLCGDLMRFASQER
jgi:dihydrofolate synthase / folylpolyglutamate synthase